VEDREADLAEKSGGQGAPSRSDGSDGRNSQDGVGRVDVDQGRTSGSTRM
jgi:hypothetical protein